MADAGNDRYHPTRRSFIKGALATGTLAAINNIAGAKDAPQRRVLSDEQLLDLVQKRTLDYAWDFAYPDNGMVRERTNNMQEYGREVVSSGATGFGIMALVVGESRGWLTRGQVLNRIEKILGFLEKADHFDGMFPHFIDPKTGKAITIFFKDDGADIVETSFLMIGLLTARQHFSGDNPEEETVRKRINALWERADWKKHEQVDPKTGNHQLIWHWSPNFGWDNNLPVQGWNEALVTYVLAASSPTHPISAEAYDQGWCKGNDFKSGRTYFGDITMPLGPAGGGPLFFSHYSFMGLSPEGLRDKHADYWQQNKNHVLLNRQHCIRNPKKKLGHSEQCWGLTSSDAPEGYNAHSPANDTGTISPTAALSSMPYTPEYSMQAMRYFYEELGDRIWGDLGFCDAFNLEKDWYAKSRIGIDQMPIVVMAENYRTGLPWELFMGCPEIQNGLGKLGFDSPYMHKQPAILTHIQYQATDAAGFLKKLCGQDGIVPMGNDEFATAAGIGANADWQVRQIRQGAHPLSSNQQEKLLRYCGYTDPYAISQAKRLLSQPVAVANHEKH